MASRKEQKEQLRKEREEREAAAKAEQRKRQLMGYGAAGVVILIAVVVGVVILAGGGSSSGDKAKGGGDASVLPDGGDVPDQKVTDLKAAATAADCELKDYPGKSREHTGDINEKIKYDSNPPSEGKHFQVPAEDGAYNESPQQKELVHTLEHGRVIIWFDPKLPKQDRANLKALFDEDSYHLVLTPDSTMKSQVAATAWNRGPTDNGTGRTLTCAKFSPAVYDALRAFRDEHRDNGPETVP